jgi:hypothetical protein
MRIYESIEKKKEREKKREKAKKRLNNKYYLEDF